MKLHAPIMSSVVLQVIMARGRCAADWPSGDGNSETLIGFLRGRIKESSLAGVPDAANNYEESE